MDFDFFNNLSLSNAEKYLANFLNESGKGFSSIRPEMEVDGVIADYSIESLLPVFNWIIVKLKSSPINEDVSLPIWIRETESYKKGLYSFDEASNILIFRFSYYMGASFVANFKDLKWSVGNKKFIQKNMPVVSGFKNNMEMAVWMVCNNLFKRAIENSTSEGMEVAIKTWSSFVNEEL